MIKNFILTLAVILGIGFFGNGILCSQNVHPSVQAKIDSLQTWLNNQMTTTGTIDETELAKWNEKIRVEQERLARQDELNKPKEDSGCRNIQFSGYSGSSFLVPRGKMWRIKKLTCSSGIGEYAIVVTSLNLKQEYSEGETIYTPSYTAESSLITNDASGVIYMYEIIEFDTH